MKRIDSLKISLAKAYEGVKAAFTDEELQIDLAEDMLSDGKKIEYSALEVDAEVFVISDEEGVEPVLLDDGDYTLEDGQMIVILEGKISEIKPKEEEVEDPAPVETELSAEQKVAIELAAKFNVEDLEKLVNMKDDAWYTIEFSVSNGRVDWADMYTNKFDVILSEQVDPIKVELEAEKKETEKLKTQIVTLQELNDKLESNPLNKKINLEDEKPKTAYEIQLGL